MSGARPRVGLLALCVSAVCLIGACAPRARPLGGLPTASILPAASLPSTPELIRFTWRYDDETFDVSGDGVVRTLAPDSARLDLFVANGYGSGMAILQGDTLLVPGIDLIRRFLPPPPLLWGALGRLALPAGRDTVVRLDGDTLRADISGTEQDKRTWRVHFAGRQLRRVERIEGSRVVEWVERAPDANGQLQLRYTHTTGRRKLQLSVTETLAVDGFDEAIWRLP